jgi:hypothetical protein
MRTPYDVHRFRRRGHYLWAGCLHVYGGCYDIYDDRYYIYDD